MAERPTIQTAEHELGLKRYLKSQPFKDDPSHDDEADPDHDHENDPAQGHVDPVKQAKKDLPWLRARQANADAMPDAEVVDRLARILSWNGQGSLHTLELEARFVEGPGRFAEAHVSHPVAGDRQALWLRASRAYRLTMTALARSGAAFPNLYIYSGTTNNGCSVPSYDITVGLPGLIDAGLGTAGASVKRLELSFSTRVDHGWRGWERAYGAEVGRQERAMQRRQWMVLFDDDNYHWNYVVCYDNDEAAEQGREIELEVDDEGNDGCDESDEDYDAEIEDRENTRFRGRYRDDYPQALCRANVPGVAELLLHMPNLQVLDLHMYQTLQYESSHIVKRLHHHHRIFSALVRHRVSLPHLTYLSLRGLIFTRRTSCPSSAATRPSTNLCYLALSSATSGILESPGTSRSTISTPDLPGRAYLMKPSPSYRPPRPAPDTPACPNSNSPSCSTSAAPRSRSSTSSRR
ncbi:hypothetical protein IMZ48_37180 [Candidatus Bathyarchaeota archaeon]|nr:hypothetical protein [Candidatus Bathyarchaeota archaeon]